MNIQISPIRLAFTYEKIYIPTKQWADNFEDEPCQDAFIEDSIGEFYDDIMNFKMDQRAQVQLVGYPMNIQWKPWDSDD